VAVSRASAAGGLRAAPAVLLGIAAAFATATATATADTPAVARVAAPKADVAWRARVVASTPVRGAPRADAPVRGAIRPTAGWDGGSVYLLVLGVADDASGRRWLQLKLPSRPNTRAGWVVAERVSVSRVRWRVEIARATRRASAYRDGRLIRSWPVVIGKRQTPTPAGLFAVYERVRQPPGSELGPWALHLTAHSDTLLNYGGGPGRVALHGRAGSLLTDPLGSARSHGCVRMDDAQIAWLAARLAPGTPVRVR
jgi:lipoprotein-anchoring transpeptidase ErfK/SrfK